MKHVLPFYFWFQRPGTVLFSSMGSARCLFPSGATCGSHGRGEVRRCQVPARPLDSPTDPGRREVLPADEVVGRSEVNSRRTEHRPVGRPLNTELCVRLMCLTRAALRRRYIKPNENSSWCPFYSQENDLFRRPTGGHCLSH